MGHFDWDDYWKHNRHNDHGKAYGYDSPCGRHVCVGSSYCCNTSPDMCCHHVWSYWWFWTLWVLFFLSIMICCVACRRYRRRQDENAYLIRSPQYTVVQPYQGAPAGYRPSCPPPNYNAYSQGHPPGAYPQAQGYQDQKQGPPAYAP